MLFFVVACVSLGLNREWIETNREWIGIFFGGGRVVVSVWFFLECIDPWLILRRGNKILIRA